MKFRSASSKVDGDDGTKTDFNTTKTTTTIAGGSETTDGEIQSLREQLATKTKSLEEAEKTIKLLNAEVRND